MPKRALTVANIQNQKISRIPFIGEFLDAFGKPQDKGVWFIWGDSGSGKSTFVMQLAYALAKIFSVLYVLLEEETDDSDYIDRTKLVGMQDVASNFHTASDSYDDLVKRLEKRNSPKVVIIDSLPYFKIDFEKYLKLKQKFKKKIFIYVGHADGKKPRTKFQEDVMYDAKMKIYINGFLAICKGRTIGRNGGKFIIYEEGYSKLHGAKAS
jgi:uridine kinase